MRAISGTVRVPMATTASFRNVFIGRTPSSSIHVDTCRSGASALNRCRFAGIQPRPSPAWASSQLEGGDAEHALETDGADRPGIHARGLKHWRKAVVLRERDRIARLTLGTSRKTSPGPSAATSAAKVASAAARSSATSGPILRPVRHGRLTPQAARRPSRTSARPTCPRALIHARRNGARGAGNTVASSAVTVANGTSASGTIPAGAGPGATVPP